MLKKKTCFDSTVGGPLKLYIFENIFTKRKSYHLLTFSFLISTLFIYVIDIHV